jgi:peptidyl-prolyl cis-trans isomerase B (cyclophilin B)
MVQAVIETNKGNIVLELFEKDTPKTVDNFVKLAKDGFYNGIKFHRVIPDFMIQAGCPKGDGTGGPGYKTECEIKPHLKHEPGTLSMAHAGTCKHNKATGEKMGGTCSNGSQFFITHVATPHLDGVHTVFGKVVEGKNVVDSIQKGDVMKKIKIQ